MIQQDVIEKALSMLRAQLGKPYEIGYLGEDGRWVVKGKPAIVDSDPRAFDCSGLVNWTIGQTGISIPQGSHDQMRFCSKLIGAVPRALDLGFADLRGGDLLADHVVIVEDDLNVIEARGAPHNCVIRRPRERWEKQAGWFGYFRVPGLYD